MDIFLKVIILIASIHLCRGADCTAPNGTSSHHVWKSCYDGPILFHNVSLLDEDYNEVYPIRATKAFTVSADVTNTGEEYDKVETSMKLYKWGGWFGCSWQRIPAFGVLDNLVRCGKGIDCPIKVGRQQLPITIDLSPIGFFIKVLPDGIPYKILFEISAPEKNAYACIELWSLIRTKAD